MGQGDSGQNKLWGGTPNTAPLRLLCPPQLHRLLLGRLNGRSLCSYSWRPWVCLFSGSYGSQVTGLGLCQRHTRFRRSAGYNAEVRVYLRCASVSQPLVCMRNYAIGVLNKWLSSFQHFLCYWTALFTVAFRLTLDNGETKERQSIQVFE